MNLNFFLQLMRLCKERLNRISQSFQMNANKDSDFSSAYWVKKFKENLENQDYCQKEVERVYRENEVLLDNMNKLKKEMKELEEEILELDNVKEEVFYIY
jgi:peptidoglycan hydrolase CwlO-like protein